ncbi:MAG: hypothetical protein KDA21_00840 [Phycisphaerales bacterium]|nr:hypothetical protein [Phycisphaerales bacterium]
MAWARLVAAARAAGDALPDGTSFVAAHPELGEKWLVLEYYSREVLRTAEARRSFVPPDLRPLPTSRGDEQPQRL